MNSRSCVPSHCHRGHSQPRVVIPFQLPCRTNTVPRSSGLLPWRFLLPHLVAAPVGRVAVVGRSDDSSAVAVCAGVDVEDTCRAAAVGRKAHCLPTVTTGQEQGRNKVRGMADTEVEGVMTLWLDCTARSATAAVGLAAGQALFPFAASSVLAAPRPE
jgi:hypothetical protein